MLTWRSPHREVVGITGTCRLPVACPSPARRLPVKNWLDSHAPVRSILPYQLPALAAALYARAQLLSGQYHTTT